MLKKICAVAAITAAAVLGTAGVASAETTGAELNSGWTWWLSDGVVELANDVADLVVDVDDDDEVTVFAGWTWW